MRRKTARVREEREVMTEVCGKIKIKERWRDDKGALREDTEGIWSEGNVIIEGESRKAGARVRRGWKIVEDKIIVT